MNEITLCEMELNFAELCANPYPGRGIIQGMTDSGNFFVQVYWLMGRSANSRNRVFAIDQTNGRLYTRAADPTKVEDPSLIIYNAMLESDDCYVVSNGDQTDMIASSATPYSLSSALRCATYEPDAPNYTPRISAVMFIGEHGKREGRMAILRKASYADLCDRVFYDLEMFPGVGHCITTYEGDGDPLPSFRGDPLLMPLQGNAQQIAETYWDALNAENRVALAVKVVPVGGGASFTHIINRYEEVA